MKMGVAADDITGANDIGIMFAKGGMKTNIYPAEGFEICLDSSSPDVCVLDTNSRLDSPEIAYRKVFEATRALEKAGCGQFFKKTCSVFRGNIGAEFDAMLDALHREFAVVVLGFPKNGRLTINGTHLVHGRPLEESEFSNDPVHPMKESDLVSILQRQTLRKVSLVTHDVIAGGPEALKEAIEKESRRCAFLILDVVNQEALKTIAAAVHDLPVLCGSSAIAEELPYVWEWASGGRAAYELPHKDNLGVFCVAGSLMPQTIAQLEHVKTRGHEVCEMVTASLFSDARREGLIESLVREVSAPLRQGRSVIVHASNTSEALKLTRAEAETRKLSRETTGRLVSETLAAVAERVILSTDCRRLVVAGGETSAAVCRRLGITGLAVYEEIEAGLPSCVTLAQPRRFLVLKSGSFGSPEFLDKAINYLASRP